MNRLIVLQHVIASRSVTLHLIINEFNQRFALNLMIFVVVVNGSDSMMIKNTSFKKKKKNSLRFVTVIIVVD